MERVRIEGAGIKDKTIKILLTAADDLLTATDDVLTNADNSLTAADEI